jgi:hypothetical protein
MSFFEMIPDRLRRSAYWSRQEAAWPKKDALEVIAFASQFHIAVIGVEIWLPTIPGPTIPIPFIYHWEMNPKMDYQTWSEYVSMSNSHAQRVVETFQWDKRDVGHHLSIPFFNFCFLNNSSENGNEVSAQGCGE